VLINIPDILMLISGECLYSWPMLIPIATISCASAVNGHLNSLCNGSVLQYSKN
jgi:hypothetical protein